MFIIICGGEKDPSKEEERTGRSGRREIVVCPACPVRAVVACSLPSWVMELKLSLYQYTERTKIVVIPAH